MKLEFTMAADVALVARPPQPISTPSPASSSAVTPSTPMRDQGSCAPTRAQPMPSRTRCLARSQTEAGTSSSVVLAPKGASRPVGPAGFVGGRPVAATAMGVLEVILGPLLCQASRGRDLRPGGNNRTGEEMASGVDHEADPGRSRVGLHPKLSDPLDTDGLHHDDVAVTPVPGRRCSADEAGQACVVGESGEMERPGWQVLAGAVPRSGREPGHRDGDIGEGPVPKA